MNNINAKWHDSYWNDSYAEQPDLKIMPPPMVAHDSCSMIHAHSCWHAVNMLESFNTQMFRARWHRAWSVL